MFKTVILLTTVALLTLQAAPLLKTGQTQSYDAYGNVVTDGSIKDDGYYQAGATSNYTRDGDVVIDNVTGYKWQDDSLVTSQTYTWSSNCSLNLGGYTDWRVPSLTELVSIIDFSSTSETVENQSFLQTFRGSFWTDYWLDSNNVWMISFINGSLNIVDPNSESYTNKTKLHRRCVRGNITAPSNFYNAESNTVKDQTTDLQWENADSVRTDTYTWTEAINHCESLNLDMHTDWRLPNIKELISIQFNKEDSSLNIGKFFSSTSYSLDPSHAWSTFDNSSSSGLSNSHSHDSSKTSQLNVRCVRTMNESRQACINNPSSCGLYSEEEKDAAVEAAKSTSTKVVVIPMF